MGSRANRGYDLVTGVGTIDAVGSCPTSLVWIRQGGVAGSSYATAVANSASTSASAAAKLRSSACRIEESHVVGGS